MDATLASESASASLIVRLFGPFEALLDGRPLPRLPTTGVAEERYELFGDDFRACATTMDGRGPSMRKSNLPRGS